MCDGFFFFFFKAASFSSLADVYFNFGNFCILKLILYGHLWVQVHIIIRSYFVS